jgi:hypothetical protein
MCVFLFGHLFDALDTSSLGTTASEKICEMSHTKNVTRHFSRCRFKDYAAEIFNAPSNGVVATTADFT